MPSIDHLSQPHRFLGRSIAWLLIPLHLCSCTSSPPSAAPTLNEVIGIHVQAGEPHPSGKRWRSSLPLSSPSLAVLHTAFDREFAEGDSRVDAYSYYLYASGKIAIPWSFPWDLPVQPFGDTYRLTWNDMRDLLRGVEVRDEMGSLVWISYGHMLEKLISRLSAHHFNEQSSGEGLVEAIYSVRNFLSIAQSEQLPEARYHLQRAAQKLIELYESQRLTVKAWEVTARNPQGRNETRNARNGIEELQGMMVRKN